MPKSLHTIFYVLVLGHHCQHDLHVQLPSASFVQRKTWFIQSFNGGLERFQRGFQLFRCQQTPSSPKINIHLKKLNFFENILSVYSVVSDLFQGESSWRCYFHPFTNVTMHVQDIFENKWKLYFNVCTCRKLYIVVPWDIHDRAPVVYLKGLGHNFLDDTDMPTD